MTYELKPCPFCGGRAIMKIQKHIPNGYDYTPTCQDPSCAGRLTKKWTNEADAIKAWNSRAERKTGKWIEISWSEPDPNVCCTSYALQSAKCSICGKYHTTPYLYSLDYFPYCPNCGSEMTR